MAPPLVVAVVGLILVGLLSAWQPDPELTTSGSIVVQGSNHVTITVHDKLTEVSEGLEDDATNPEAHTDESVSTNPSLPQDPLALVNHILPIIQEHEGYSEEPYLLHGLPHVCWGHQLEQMEPKTRQECEELLAEDTALAIATARDYAGPVWEDITVSQRGVLVELAYTLGRTGLMSFVELRKAVWQKDWDKAKAEIQDSLLPGKDQLGQERVNDIKGRLDG